jgi:hypothetical protein
MMEEGQEPKLPLLMRATVVSWWENSDSISEAVMKDEEESLGFLGIGCEPLMLVIERW